MILTQISKNIGTEPFSWLDKIGNRIGGTLDNLRNDSDSMFFDCNLCYFEENLKIDVNDITIELSSGTEYTITATVHTQDINDSNLNVTFKGQDDSGLVTIEDDNITAKIEPSNDYNATVTMDLAGINYLHIYVDPNKEIDEPKTDNYVLIPVVEKKLKANLSVDTGYSRVDTAIKDYLSFYIDDTTVASSDVVVSIGKFTPEVDSYNDNTLGQIGRDWGVIDNTVYVDKTPLPQPYSGIVGSYKPILAKPRIFIYGTRIEGTIAAIKSFISAREVFFNAGQFGENVTNQKVVILDRYDTSAIGVFDLMNNVENKPYLLENTNEFANVVTKVLNDNNFEISIKTVKTNASSYSGNTTLRLKHANSDYSSDYKDAIVENQKPVVLSSGLWSNLFTWEDFAKELANEGRDSWLIEITGGPKQDCETCPNYEYADLVDYYWPALIAGVEHYSGQNTLDYVGFSNGCRVALDSLKNWSASGKNNAGYCFNTGTGQYDIGCDLASDPVDTFVGVGCPGAFDGSSRFITKSIENGDVAITKHSQKGRNHITMKEHAKEIDWMLSHVMPAESKISLNLLDFYNDIAISTSDPQPGGGITINKVYFVAGNYTNKLIESGVDNDFIVPIEDMLQINKTISSQDSDIMITRLRHDQLASDASVSEYIKSRLRGE